MHRHGLVAGLSLLAALAAACGTDYHHDYEFSTMPTAVIVGSGQFVSESRPLQAVSRVVASGGLQATVSRGSPESLDITAEDNILPLLDCVERDGTLFLGWKPGSRSVSAHEIVIRIRAGELRSVDASGGSRIGADGIATPDFNVTLSGAAQFSASGSVERLVVELSGASRVLAADLASRAVTARLSGASHGTLRMRDSLRASVSGASLLEFYGDPVVDAAVSDTSVVRRVGP
jgi:hypothetical protein